MYSEIRLFILFDMLGDIERSGLIQWKIKRKRLADVKNHLMDLVVLCKLMKPYLPDYIDVNKMIDYAIIHDLAEVITGDITTFEGVTKEQKKKVEQIATNYLINEFHNTINFEKNIKDYENQNNIEAKVVHMLDKTCSIIEFLKYDSENKVDMDNPEIIEVLRNNKKVCEMKNEGMSLGEVFYNWHLKNIVITDEEIDKYNISRYDADKITISIKDFINQYKKEIENKNVLLEKMTEEAKIYRYINEK